jgi:hypothetical protein
MNQKTQLTKVTRLLMAHSEYALELERKTLKHDRIEQSQLDVLSAMTNELQIEVSKIEITPSSAEKVLHLIYNRYFGKFHNIKENRILISIPINAIFKIINIYCNSIQLLSDLGDLASYVNSMMKYCRIDEYNNSWHDLNENIVYRLSQLRKTRRL